MQAGDIPRLSNEGMCEETSEGMGDERAKLVCEHFHSECKFSKKWVLVSNCDRLKNRDKMQSGCCNIYNERADHSTVQERKRSAACSLRPEEGIGTG